MEQQIAEHAIVYRENHYRLAYSYVRNEDDALDIVQESIYKAISSINSLKHPDYIKTWFYRIVVNTSLDSLRKRKRLDLVEEDVLLSFDSGKVDKYEEFDLKKALEELPERYRIIVILRYFEDLKIEEIAEVLNENINTVKTRLYKSLEILRLNLKEV
ncbi:MAG: sigma-70 family RNA polymerase sigma factor [Tissierellia bacterium]|nr:sigma-70 family RNA polymerase sigma factor [Tissierellia bacterium]